MLIKIYIKYSMNFKKLLKYFAVTTGNHNLIYLYIYLNLKHNKTKAIRLRTISFRIHKILYS